MGRSKLGLARTAEAQKPLMELALTLDEAPVGLGDPGLMMTEQAQNLDGGRLRCGPWRGRREGEGDVVDGRGSGRRFHPEAGRRPQGPRSSGLDPVAQRRGELRRGRHALRR